MSAIYRCLATKPDILSACGPASATPSNKGTCPEWRNTRLRPHPSHGLLVVLVLLAGALILWGTRYKLSLYHSHPHHSFPVTAAKLWMGPRATAPDFMSAGPDAAVDLYFLRRPAMYVPEHTSQLRSVADPALPFRISTPLCLLRAPPSYFL